MANANNDNQYALGNTLTPGNMRPHTRVLSVHAADQPIAAFNKQSPVINQYLSINSFECMGTYTYTLFLNFFSVKPYSINSRGIQLVISHIKREDQE